VPRCQRTFRRLSPRDPEAAVCWTCPHCDDREVYEAVVAPDLRQYAQAAVRSCRQRFCVPDDGRRTRLYLGLFPECVCEADEGRFDLYLQRGSDPFQLRLQVGHEAFHRVCSGGTIYHWTHEMLACLFSVWCLEAAGLGEYAALTERGYAAEAAHRTLAELLGADLSSPPYPRGVYGRAYATGKALEAVVGRDGLCRLVACADRAGNPDLPQWINSLRPDEAATVRQVMNMEP
jgi:hypothetical protein